MSGQARDKFAPPAPERTLDAEVQRLKQSKIQADSSGAPEALKKQDAPIKTRPALSPDDGSHQLNDNVKKLAAEAGKGLANHNVTGGQSVQASERFSPPQTPDPPAHKGPSHSR